MVQILLATAQGQGDMVSALPSVGLLLLFIPVFYLIVVRPQKKREKELKDQVDKMSIGDKIITIGGVTGVLAHINEDEVTIYTSAANTPITFQKAAIQTVVPRNGEKKDAKKENTSDKKKSKKASKTDEED